VALADVTTKRRSCGARGARRLVVGGLRGLGVVLTGHQGVMVFDMDDDEESDDEESEEEDEEEGALGDDD
jgi:hypothetical protein